MTVTQRFARSRAQARQRGVLVAMMLTSFGATTPAAAQEPKGAKEFADVCASCHGPTGRGQVGPRLVPMRKSLEEFLAIVREGQGEMPPISSRELSDDQVRSIWEYLHSLGTPPARSVGSVSDASVVRQTSMRATRVTNASTTVRKSGS